MRATQGGFTLIEVIAALVIFTAASLALTRAASGGVALERAADAHRRAGHVAQTLLAEAGTVFPLWAGERAGQSAEGMRWLMRVEPAATIAGPGALRLLRLNLRIEWRSGFPARTRSLSLTALRVVGPDGLLLL